MIQKLVARAALLLSLSASLFAADVEEGFVPLFDGKSLSDWKIAGNKEAFTVKDEAIVAKGDCSHAFYVGKVHGGKFANFELRADVMTEDHSNGGIFIHTTWQDQGWPAAGYEVQVNNTHGDWKKSGGLYNFADNKVPFKDHEWMKYVIRVKDGKVFVSVNDKVTVDNYVPEEGKSRLQKEGGAIALQAHDNGSVVHYKNIRIKVLD